MADGPGHVVVDQEAGHLPQVGEGGQVVAHIAGVQHLVVGGDMDRALLQGQLCQQWTVSRVGVISIMLDNTKNPKMCHVNFVA